MNGWQIESQKEKQVKISQRVFLALCKKEISKSSVMETFKGSSDLSVMGSVQAE